MANVLVVDDDPDLGETFAEVLAALRHTTRLARNGREAITLLLEDTPDLIVSDVEMPVLTGPEMASEICVRNTGLERIPIILVSGIRDLPRVAARLGTPYFLTKPFTLDRVSGILIRALTERAAPHPVTDAAGGPP
jgi:DNA-binding NtrC family response regulator